MPACQHIEKKRAARTARDVRIFFSFFFCRNRSTTLLVLQTMHRAHNISRVVNSQILSYRASTKKSALNASFESSSPPYSSRGIFLGFRVFRPIFTSPAKRYSPRAENVGPLCDSLPSAKRCSEKPVASRLRDIVIPNRLRATH